MAPPRKRRIAHEQVVFYYTLLGGLPATIIATTLLLSGDYTAKVQWTLGLLMAG
ncbi:MAG: C4-dicarboxylate transport sensor protein DctB, partial [Verrucomicrobiota bacterium]